MAEPNEKMSRTILLIVITAFTAMIFGWIGEGLKPVVFSADTWGGIASGFAWLAGEVSKFTSSLWFLIPFAALVGSWLGISADRWLRNRRRPQREAVWITLPPPPPPAPKEDPVELEYKRMKTLNEFRDLESELRVILRDPYKSDDQKLRLLIAKNAEIDSFYVTMKKVDLVLPKLYERDLFEFTGLSVLLSDLKPFLEAKHWPEASERLTEDGQPLEAKFLERHTKFTERRAIEKNR